MRIQALISSGVQPDLVAKLDGLRPDIMSRVIDPHFRVEACDRDELCVEKTGFLEAATHKNMCLVTLDGVAKTQAPEDATSWRRAGRELRNVYSEQLKRWFGDEPIKLTVVIIVSREEEMFKKTELI